MKVILMRNDRHHTRPSLFFFAAWIFLMFGALGLFGLATEAKGNSYSWAAPVNGTFSVSGNWSQPFGQGGSYPMPGDFADFEGTNAYTVTCTGNANAYTEVDSPLTFQMSGSYDVQSNLTIDVPVTVTGSYVFTAATLTISPYATLIVSDGSFETPDLECNNPFPEVPFQIIVTNGGALTTPTTVNGSPNAIVAGLNSIWNHEGSLQMGNGQVLDGAELEASNCASSWMIVGGNDSIVDCADFSTTTLSITNGGVITCVNGAINNYLQAVVSGPGATWTVSEVYSNALGDAGLLIADGGTMSCEDFLNSGSGCTVGGVGSTLTIYGRLNTGIMQVTNGGALILNGTNVTNSSIIVRDVGSLLHLNALLIAPDSSFGVFNGAAVSHTTLNLAPVSGTSRALTVDGSASQLNLSGDLTIGAGGTGTVLVSDQGLLKVDGDLTVGNGTLTISTGGQVQCQDVDVAAQPTASASISISDSGSVLQASELNIGFGGQGSVSVSGSGSAEISGSIELGSQGTMNVSGGGVTLGATSPAAATGTLQINGDGALSGTGTIDGNVINSGGAVNPGAGVGTMKIKGNYTQSGSGVLNVVLGGTNSGQSSQLGVTGSISLGGELSVTLTNGFAPPIGTQIEIITNSSRSGTFATTQLVPGLSVTYSNAGVFLDVTGNVPPQIANVHEAANNCVFSFGTSSNQTYTVQQNSSLATAGWTTFTNFTGDGSVHQVVAPVTNAPQKFFRVLLQ